MKVCFLKNVKKGLKCATKGIGVQYSAIYMGKTMTEITLIRQVSKRLYVHVLTNLVQCSYKLHACTYTSNGKKTIKYSQ